jgi:uncharacterized protein
MGPNHDATLDGLIENLAASAVDRAVIMAEAVDVPYIKRITNDFVGECRAKHPDTLIGFASVHPLEPDAPQRLEEDVPRYGLQGLKLHPRFQGVAADDDRVVPIVEKAAELGLPVAIDALLWKPTPLTLQLPMHIDALAKRVPEARIIMSHAGGFRFLDALAVVVANDNVYLEISVALEYFADTPFEDQFMFVLKQAGAGRIIYGSDYPQKPMLATLEHGRALLTKHGFSEEDQAKIFGGTLLSLLPQSTGGS